MDSFFCFSCMSPLSSLHETCPVCGHDNHIRQNKPGMLPETVIGGQYLVGRVLGCGGFGVTYLGYDLSLRRKVAIKEFFPGKIAQRKPGSTHLEPVAGLEEHYRKGFERALSESRTAAGLGVIPGVVQVYNVVAANSTVYIIMEYIDGCTLKEYLKKHVDPLPMDKVIALLTPAVQALMDLHARGIIHRDIKPDNIMVRSQDQRTVLLDFGAARAAGVKFSASGAIISRGFSPAEQYSSLTLTERADEYALAATLYYLLTADYPTESIHRLAAMSPLAPICRVNPTVTPAQEAVLFRAMSVRADDRYPTVKEMWNALLSQADTAPASHVLQSNPSCSKSLEEAVTEPSVLPHSIPVPSSASARRSTQSRPAPAPASKRSQVVLILSLIGIIAAAIVCVCLFVLPDSKPAEPVPVSATTEAPAFTQAPASAPKIAKQPDPTPTPTPSPLPLLHFSPTPTPTPTPTPMPTSTPTPTPTPTSTPTPTPTPTPTLRPKPASTPTPEPVPEPADYEAEFATVNDFDLWFNGSGTWTVLGYLGHDREIEVPRSHNSIPVTTISECCFEDNHFITSVVLPEGVDSIGGGAFKGCSALHSVTLPQSLQMIGEEAFAGCSGLTLIVERGSYAAVYAKANGIPYHFAGELVRQDPPQEIPSVMPETSPFVSGTDESLFVTGQTNDGVSIKGYTGSERDIIIPSHIGGSPVTAITSGAFSDSEVITSVVLPGTITSIGEKAFFNCDYLVSIDIPEGVTAIHDQAFSSCKLLTSVHLPSTLRELGANVFSNCSSLQTVVFEDGLTLLAQRAFEGCRKLENVTLPSTLREIETASFQNCQALDSIYLPASVETIAGNAFSGCRAIVLEVHGDSYAHTYAQKRGLEFKVID